MKVGMAPSDPLQTAQDLTVTFLPASRMSMTCKECNVQSDVSVSLLPRFDVETRQEGG